MKGSYVKMDKGMDPDRPKVLALGALVGNVGVIDVSTCAPVGPKSKYLHEITVEMQVDAAEQFAREILDEVAAVRAMLDEKLARLAK